MSSDSSASASASASTSSTPSSLGCGGIRGDGEFNWFNILAPDAEKAKEFFGKLLRWQYNDIPGTGGWELRVADKEGKNSKGIGAMFPQGEHKKFGITLMIKVKSADETAAKIKENGGTVRGEPFDIGGNLRMAVAFDNRTAEFDPFEPKATSGTEVDRNLHGAPSWFELFTDNPEESKKFYAGAFGWTHEDVDMGKNEGGNAKKYTRFSVNGRPCAGMMNIMPGMDPKPMWTTYFTVEDTDATVKLAAELGGKVCMPPMDIPNVGRIAGIVSPDGIYFYVCKYNRSS